MIIKIGELVKATENIKIFKWIPNSIKNTLLNAASNEILDFYFLKDDIATIVGYTDYDDVSPPNFEYGGFYLLLYKNNIWINLWDEKKFNKCVRIISFNV